ncbi:dnaJ homolog subfamily C member 22 [Octopus bimaculoides]|uniref:DnaJ homolog subfamily C member 22 n=1 Tax=Octopus bimaculoides TaxID=37653 RepID=A0A0L8GI65_OCTBM|nr:dnaJ homolog subfamily C member 22 [Octopus bimaculoides]XP_014780825.1 dnaJ homolog subfamily C member 22 [Octopus bimaculoides]|eukprot:XP_014780824.1 PREDICTED: dnaJ homolog subfamily C member 22-like [Octopus bimaculoides]
MAKVVIAYILWFFGGLFGIHHIYLNRDNQALVWWATLAGCGIGWFRDLWRIPFYVHRANNDHFYVEEMKDRKRIYSHPPITYERIITQIFISALFAYLFYSAWPSELLESYGSLKTLVVAVFTPLVAAYGVMLVANIGDQEGDLKLSLIGSFLGVPFYWNNPTQIIYSSLISTALLNYKGNKWSKTMHRRSRTSCPKRTLRITIFCCIYLMLWVSVICHNITVTNSNGEERKLSEVISTFLASPAWEETKESVWFLFEYGTQYGWYNLAEAVWKIFDSDGIHNAYKVLGLHHNASLQEIKSSYRKLVKEWHPDRHKDPKMKEIASKHFITIQSAYITLTKDKSSRSA